MRHASRARAVLRDIPIPELLKMVKKAGELYTKGELPLGDGTQRPRRMEAVRRAVEVGRKGLGEELDFVVPQR